MSSDSLIVRLRFGSSAPFAPSYLRLEVNVACVPKYVSSSPLTQNALKMQLLVVTSMYMLFKRGRWQIWTVLQEDLHDEAVKTVEAIKTASSAPWWLKIGATEEATQLMQEPAAYLAGSIGLAGIIPAAHVKSLEI